MAAMVGRGTGGDGLLPKTYEEFGTKRYWEDFFKQREEKAFEWYGAYSDLSEYVSPVVGKDDRVLVIGCGNSDFSTDLYRRGGHRNITNVDFSEVVIEEMRNKTAQSCPLMQWRVMDVTAMSPFTDGSWDVVVDKGTLDAIYNTEENEEQADRMLDEVERVLQPDGGRYLIITLGQDFIFRKLLQRFASGRGGWTLSLSALEAKTGARASPFLTLVGVATRHATSSPPALSVGFDSTAKWVTRPVAFGVGDHEAALAHVVAAREWHHTRYEMSDIRPGRFKGDVDIWMRGGGGGEEGAAMGPRYTLSIVDLVPPTRTPDPCGVFLIPQDRSHEWLFSTAEGLRQVAEGSTYRRMICVRMNRGHKFKDIEEVKGELGSIVADFFPSDQSPDFRVPYLAVGELDDGSRVEVESGDLPLCGPYSVEEEDTDGPTNAVLRRLIFLRNQHVIQTEVRLAPPKKSGGGGGGKKKKAGGGSKKGGKGKDGEASSSPPALVMDYGYMCFDYHRAMLSGLWLMAPTLKAAKSEGRRMRALVLGLGGGALPLFLVHTYPCLDVTVMELEGGLRDVAAKWFGFVEGDGLRVEVGDGLAKVVKSAEAEPGSMDVVMVDVDNKDASIGMSCPGPEFLTPAFLQAARRLLRPSGMLVMNLAARTEEARGSAIRAILQAFEGGDVLQIHPSEEDMNRVVFALNQPRSSSSSKATLAVGLERWLAEGKVGGGADPLELADLLTRVTTVVVEGGQQANKA